MLISLKYLNNKYHLNIKGVIHVGGHHGQELADYEKFDFKIIHIFEPLLKNFKILNKKISKFKNLEIFSYNYALGSKEDRVLMNCSSNDLESSSILQPKIHLVQHPKIKFEEKEIVNLKDLDSFKIKNVNFLNIDVQGYELEVLKGSKETLKYIDYVYCEINRDETYEGNPLVEDIDFFLNQFNFKRCETKWASRSLSWGDAFYIRSNKVNLKTNLINNLKIFFLG